ncbi:MAG: hypothetical protein HZA34_04335 [Candidatus Pacebacteria bacterium]|nr:hypothetical protein [Candidatus Paceibacterota bacterium]
MIKLKTGTPNVIVNLYYGSNGPDTEHWATVNLLSRDTEGHTKSVRDIETVSIENLGVRAPSVIADMLEDAIKQTGASEIMGLGFIPGGFHSELENKVWDLLAEKGIIPLRGEDGESTRRK